MSEFLQQIKEGGMERDTERWRERLLGFICLFPDVLSSPVQLQIQRLRVTDDQNNMRLQSKILYVVICMCGFCSCMNMGLFLNDQLLSLSLSCIWCCWGSSVSSWWCKSFMTCLSFSLPPSRSSCSFPFIRCFSCPFFSPRSPLLFIYPGTSSSSLKLHHSLCASPLFVFVKFSGENGWEKKREEYRKWDFFNISVVPPVH